MNTLRQPYHLEPAPHDQALHQMLTAGRVLPSNVVGNLLASMLDAPQARLLPGHVRETLGKDAIRRAIAQYGAPLELLEANVPAGFDLADGLVEGLNTVDGVPVMIRRLPAGT